MQPRVATLTCNLVWVATRNATESLASKCDIRHLLSYWRAPRHPLTQWGGEMFTFVLPVRLPFLNTAKFTKRKGKESRYLKTRRSPAKGGDVED